MNSRTFHALVAIALLGLSTCAATPPANPESPRTGPKTPAARKTDIQRDQPARPLDAKDFVQLAAWSGQREILLSQLALEVGLQESLLRFADRVVQDHTQAHDRLRAIAAAKGIQFPATNHFSLIAPPVAENDDRLPVRAPNATPQRPREGVGTRIDPAAAARNTGWPLAEPDLEDVRRLRELTGASFEHAYIGQMVRDHLKGIELFQRATKLDDPELRQFAEQTLPILQSHYDEAVRIASETGGLEIEPLKPRPFRRQSERR
jgi:putative membrane protein